MPNFDLATQTICSKSAKIDQHGHAVQEDYPSLEVGPLCNLFGSDGKPGPVRGALACLCACVIGR